MTTPIYKCWTKGTTREEGEPRRSFNWATSRRAWFKVFDDRIECGNWIIPKISIRDAVLFQSKQFFVVPVSVLQLRTDDASYQFGFNPWCRIAQRLPFQFRTETIKLGHSPFSLVVRVAVGIYLIYWIWQRWS